MVEKLQYLMIVLLVDAGIWWLCLKIHLIQQLTDFLNNNDKKLIYMGLSVPIILINYITIQTIIQS